MQQKILAVVNQKGGVGKTTSTINIAAQLAESGKQVLVIDSDPQGNSTSGFGIEKQQQLTTYDLLCQNAPLSEVVIETGHKNLYLIPANPNLAGAEVSLVNELAREFKLRDSLRVADYDYILIDCPPSLGLLTINALAAASDVLIPVQAEYYALEGLSQLLTTVQRIREGGINPSLQIFGVMVTMYDKRTSLSDQVLGELTNYFGDKMFKTTIPRNVRLAEAPSFGKTIFEHDKWSKGAKAYKQLTKEILNRE